MFQLSSDWAFPLMMSSTILLSLAMIGAMALAAWREWIGLQRAKLQQNAGPVGEAQNDNIMAARIEMADLRERLRQLEAIAAGIDL